MTDSALVPASGPLHRLLRRDRTVVLAAVVALAGASWAHIAYLSWEMGRMDMEMAMPMARAWTAVDLLLLWVMWAVMMIAMMLPSAAPMILLFASIQRRRKEQARPYVPAGIFVLGYLVVWALYGALATLLQWGLHEAALLSPMMVSTSALVGGGLLTGAGLFQFTPLKSACLRTCRSPMGFLSTEWREGARGALVMGVRHGIYCVGCCWILMALLFVVGVMNLVWVALVAGFVLVEKLAPSGEWVGRVTGAVLVAAGLWMIVQGTTGM